MSLQDSGETSTGDHADLGAHVLHGGHHGEGYESHPEGGEAE